MTVPNKSRKWVAPSFTMISLAVLFLLVPVLLWCWSCGMADRPGMHPAESTSGPPIPEFPWPPPEASARDRIERDLLATGSDTSLGAVGSRLETALSEAGYGDWSWFSVPKGFALVSQLEQINDDGTPVEAPGRWNQELDALSFVELIRHFKYLFVAREGHYRVVVFIVTDQPFTYTPERPTSEEANGWLASGGSSLPPTIGAIPFSDQHTCTALIYEFEQQSRDHGLEFRTPSSITGRQHLVGSGVRLALEE